MTASEQQAAPVQADLRQRIAQALRDAAYDCDGHCGLDETECLTQHPIEVAVEHYNVVTDVYGPVTAIAEVAAGTVRAELDALREQLAEARATGQRLNRRAQQVESKLTAAVRAARTWQVTEHGTYLPLRSLAALARLLGRDIPDARFELHYHRVERLQAELDRTLNRPIEVVRGGRRLRPGCPDPIECDHEAAAGQLREQLAAAEAENTRLRALLAHDHAAAYHQGEPRDGLLWHCGRDHCTARPTT